MNKDNIFKSSEFYMGAGDVLHLLIIDETGTAVALSVNSDGNESTVAPETPTATDATNIDDDSFVANWGVVENSLGYYLDVATDISFTSMVAGFNGLDVGFVGSYSVTGLSIGEYFYRIRAYNGVGTSGNSNIITVQTIVVLDEIVIGSQTWALYNVADNIASSRVYDDNEANRATYGGLYSWDMIPTIEALYPGWHVPTEAEILTLAAYLGGATIAGGKMKEIEAGGTWLAPSPGDNSSGWTGRGGGYYGVGVGYAWQTYDGFWWTATEAPDPAKAKFSFLECNSTIIYPSDQDLKTSFMSLRLIKD